MTQPSVNPNEKDFWDKLLVGGKFIAAVAIPVVLAIFSWNLEQTLQDRDTNLGPLLD